MNEDQQQEHTEEQAEPLAAQPAAEEQAQDVPQQEAEATNGAGQDEQPEKEDRTSKLLRLNLANLKKKVLRGGVLSQREIEMLKSESSDAATAPRFAKNQVELSNILGVERKTIQRWLKEPGNPGAKADGRLSVEEWKQWAEENGKKVGDSINTAAEKAKNVLLQNEILEFRLKVLRRDYVPMADVEVVGAKLAVALRKVIGTIHLLAPSLEQVTAADAEALLKDKEDELIGQIRVLANDLATLGEATSEQIKPGDEEG